MSVGFKAVLIAGAVSFCHGCGNREVPDFFDRLILATAAIVCGAESVMRSDATTRRLFSFYVPSGVFRWGTLGGYDTLSLPLLWLFPLYY